MATSKKTSASKSAKSKTQAKQSPQRIKLKKELVNYIDRIDDEGLIFLLKQAHVLIHNIEVDKINREIVELESVRSKSKKPAAQKQAASSAVDIKPSSDNKTFIIVINNARKIFSLDEMRSLVGISNAATSDADGSARLYRWFSQNRGDVLGDAGIGSPGNPVLALLYRLVKKTYKVKK
jgi:hypothetical protein